MVYLAMVLCAVCFTYSVFLIARFAIKKKDDVELADSDVLSKLDEK